MTYRIAPSILSADCARLGEEVQSVIAAGALVEVIDDSPAWFLLSPAAGGLEITHDGLEITLLTPESALYQKLLGLRTGDQLDDPPLFVSEIL